MKLFQKLINLLSLSLLMLIALVWLGKTINLTSDNTIIKSTNFNVDKNGNVTCNNANLSGKITATSGTIGGFSVVGDADNNRRLRSDNKKVGMSSSTWTGDPAFWAGNADPWENSGWRTNTPFVVTNEGKLIASDVQITGGKLNVSANIGETMVRVYNNSLASNVTPGSFEVDDGISEAGYLAFVGYVQADQNYGYIRLVNDDVTEETTIAPWGINTPSVTQTSLESQKKNFEKYQNALETLKNIDIYKYNLKSEKDGTKKHLGFVIGDNYNYSEEVTSKNNDGVDIYSFVSLCCKAIQEQQAQIEELQKEIKELKGGK